MYNIDLKYPPFHHVVVIDAIVAALVIAFAITIPSWLLPFVFYIQVSANLVGLPYYHFTVLQITPYIMENLTFTFSQGHRYVSM